MPLPPSGSSRSCRAATATAGPRGPGAYGGGGGGAGNNFARKAGAKGAVRIIWPGTSRSFPSTNTGDL